MTNLLLLTAIGIFFTLPAFSESSVSEDSLANVPSLFERNAPYGTISWSKELRLESGTIERADSDATAEANRKEEQMPVYPVVSYFSTPKKLTKLIEGLAAYEEKCKKIPGILWSSRPKECSDFDTVVAKYRGDISYYKAQASKEKVICSLGVPGNSSTIIIPPGKARYEVRTKDTFSRRLGPGKYREIILSIKTETGTRTGVISCNFAWSDWAEAQEQFQKSGFQITAETVAGPQKEKVERLRLDESSVSDESPNGKPNKGSDSAL